MKKPLLLLMNCWEGVTYETAGSLQEGRRTWILAKLPQRYIISGDEITPYLVFMNSHDGTGAIKAAMTPIRVVCQNTLNLAPDLKHIGKNEYRFVNAVSDFATHSKPLRERANYRESLFSRTVDGNAMIDKAYSLVTEA